MSNETVTIEFADGADGGHWVTIDGNHVLLKDGDVGHSDIAGAAQKLGLSTQVHGALKAANDAGQIATHTHLYTVIGHAKQLQKGGLNERLAYQTALKLHAASGGVSSMAATGAHGVSEAKVSNLHTDPERFQYKVNVGAKGTNSELSGVQKWNPNLAGVQLVWHDKADGKDYIINGHHRHELAERLGVDKVAVRHIDAKDAAEARYIGAVANIAEGRGTAIDAAKLLRDNSVTPEKLAEDGVSLKGKVASDGLALSKLPDALWQKVYKGEISTARGVAIGSSGLQTHEMHLLHDTVTAHEAKGKRLSDGEVSELAKHIQSAGETTHTTSSLFGEEEVKHNLFIEKAQLSAYLKQKLGQDKRLFGFVSKGNRADELGKAGNKINVHESQKIAEQSAKMEEIVNRLAHRSGPVSDAINTAATKLAKGENADAVKRELYQHVSNAVHTLVSGGTGHHESASADSGDAKEHDHSPGFFSEFDMVDGDEDAGFSEFGEWADGDSVEMAADYIERDADIFRAGNYPKKKFSASQADIAKLAKAAVPIPIMFHHVMGKGQLKLGEVISLSAEGDWLKGKMRLLKTADEFLKEVGVNTLSATIYTDFSRIPEVSVTDDPHVAGAQMFADYSAECVSFAFGATPDEEGNTMTESTVTAEQFAETQTELARLKTQNEALREQQTAQQKTVAFMESALKREQASKTVAQFSKKITPAARPYAEALMIAGGSVEFSNGEATEEKTVPELFAGFMANMPDHFAKPIHGEAAPDLTLTDAEKAMQKSFGYTDEEMKEIKKNLVSMSNKGAN